jgi:hypothetical protein
MKRAAASAMMVWLAACSTTADQSGATTASRCRVVPWTEAGKPIIRASVNGRELTFVVDTGAEYDGWINPELAKDLGLPVVGTVPADGDPTGGAPFYGVDALRLGSMVFANRRLGALPQLGSGKPPFDGIIGNGLFTGMQTVFDYQRGALQVTDRKLDGGAVVPFDKYNIPELVLHVGDKPVLVHLDTGNMASKLFVTASDAQALKFVGEPVQKGRARTISGAFDVMEATLADPVRYGSTVLPITTVRWPGAYDAGQIGSAGLAGQTVRIDWRSRRVSIMPEAASLSCP